MNKNADVIINIDKIFINLYLESEYIIALINLG